LHAPAAVAHDTSTKLTATKISISFVAAILVVTAAAAEILPRLNLGANIL
jgi:hypothetical protein